MQTERPAASSAFQAVSGWAVAADFDDGSVTSDAGALLLGQADATVGLVDRLAACFEDHRDGRFVEHSVRTLVDQRVCGIALGYEGSIDHDVLRGDPAMAVLAGKLHAKRWNCTPVAGKSTSNRLELGGLSPSGDSKLVHDGSAIADVSATLFLDAHEEAPKLVAVGVDRHFAGGLSVKLGAGTLQERGARLGMRSSGGFGPAPASVTNFVDLGVEKPLSSKATAFGSYSFGSGGAARRSGFAGPTLGRAAVGLSGGRRHGVERVRSGRSADGYGVCAVPPARPGGDGSGPGAGGVGRRGGVRGAGGVARVGRSGGADAARP